MRESSDRGINLLHAIASNERGNPATFFPFPAIGESVPQGDPARGGEPVPSAAEGLVLSVAERAYPLIISASICKIGASRGVQTPLEKLFFNLIPRPQGKGIKGLGKPVAKYYFLQSRASDSKMGQRLRRIK
jgi:hypothetical protein